MKTKTCPLCGQKMDIYTTAHKNVPFVDNKTYATMCFTCYFVPKTSNQKYNKEGLVTEEIQLPYSCLNLHTPKELHDLGASDTLKQARISVEAVQNACSRIKNPKVLKKPEASWNID